MQADGNLVLSSLRTGQVTWSTNTQNHPGAWATMQDDGNFIVYAPGWKSKWSTSTWNAVDAANSATLTWDVEGKLATLTQGGATTSYLYDADGNQLIRRNPGKVTVNLGGDELSYDTGTKTSTGTRYYNIPGGITLVRQGPTKLTYQFSDHHGTNDLSIDRTTLTESRRTLDPFGTPRGPGSNTTPWSGDKGFAGGLKDDLTGFTNLGARQYQPTTGRFLSPDPVLAENDPQQWAAYSYSHNNPVNRSDGTGLYDPDLRCERSPGNIGCNSAEKVNSQVLLDLGDPDDKYHVGAPSEPSVDFGNDFPYDPSVKTTADDEKDYDAWRNMGMAT
ncbi:RHS repeat-associated core domain-containing protein [Kitasatospora sp. NPDC097643]|uniref:RHS repeat-associated core domain-containing protein n=1 Tax=Kitasatospora sp. NPDC097643 TaxID=3157230 RepID=UPI00332717DC